MLEVVVVSDVLESTVDRVDKNSLIQDEAGSIEFALSQNRRQVLRLEELADRIVSRDAHLLRSVSRHLLETGLDLIEAKRLVNHGCFEKWCRSKLGYSKRKAEMQMAAAEMFGRLLKNETVSDLPPVSVAYALSAPSLDPDIRDRFLPRALKGEKVGPELRRAIRDHRVAAKGRMPSSDDRGQGQRGDDGPATCTAVAEQHGQAELDEGQAAARSAAVTLIVGRFGDGLSELLKLVAEAGPGVILGPEIEGELQVRSREKTASVEDKAAVVADEPEVADVEAVPALTMSEVGPPASSVPTTADEEHVARPIPDEAAAADVPLPVPTMAPHAVSGKYGDLKRVVSTFPTGEREQRPRYRRLGG